VDAYLVLDTDAASHVQRGSFPPEHRDLLIDRTLCITFVTVAEFYKGAFRKGWGERRLATLEQWLRNVVVLPYDAEVARTWGRICADRERRGRTLPVNDAWIAACCLSRDLPLLTYNRRHFEEIPGLRLLPEVGPS
jgi:predicted nucleic acid-binding protein